MADQIKTDNLIVHQEKAVEGRFFLTDNLIVHQEKAALYRLGMWLIDHRKAVAAVAYTFTALMLYFAFHMQMFTEFGDLLPYRHPFVQVHTKFANQFGGANKTSTSNSAATIFGSLAHPPKTGLRISPTVVPPRMSSISIPVVTRNMTSTQNRFSVGIG